MNSLSNLLEQARAVAEAGHDEAVNHDTVRALDEELAKRTKTVACYRCARATITAWPVESRRDRAPSLGAGVTACSAGGVPAGWYDNGVYQSTAALFCSSFEPAGAEESVGFE